MKVLQINSFFSVGGPPRIVQGIYQTLEANGHECVVAAGREKPYSSMKTIQIGTPFNKYWHLIMSRVLDAQGTSSTISTKRFVKQIEAYDPDVIHLHNLHGYYLNVEILFDYLKSVDKPVVWTLHDCWPFTGHCAHFDFIGCEKWKTECRKCPQKAEYPSCNGIDGSRMNYLRKKEAFVGLNNLTIVTPSKWLGELVKESFLREYPIAVINNGIDLELFKPVVSDFRHRYNIEDKKIILGVAQVWGTRKGLRYFIELSSMLGDDFKIVLVGLTDKEKQLLPANVIGLSRTNSIRELVEIYTAADVFVNPTLEEVFGLTNLEALACGTPVITFDTGGSPESIDDSCGLVVIKTNIHALATAIRNITNNMLSASNCVKRAELFEKSAKYQEYLKLYSSIKKHRRKD